MSDEVSLWDLARPSVTAEDATPELMEEHGDKFRPRFQEELEDNIPAHSYKIYRDFVEGQELSDDEKAVLKALKAVFAEKWLDQKKDEVNSE